ncbi:isoleucine--tRNA ligase [Candidatus Kaiserbacteria bacterium CG10_big_fil_rev_8_21_14_0_10_49_17]|uniref:Isoleucine--tRNA ligase n=1 Tax=Candidatus Kaiserbacteria bacterium CG10_big_fil_rev_8_21_14_0_10_49_17 TaxID=1974609 RepID=A0A2M6WDN4_9BACT|nr:MAG: isoleucine--tRNA ligase [Candidatus Kaiserbacteria bacterium CG10_big_fil_rev_8_21_14_0_10_49_17]
MPSSKLEHFRAELYEEIYAETMGTQSEKDNIEKGKSTISLREEEILSFWRENDIFKKTERKDAPKGEFVFYDGPPFATGIPHHGHMLASTIKDAIPRYQTMRGHRVSRRWGWDCHGLPLETHVEDELGFKTKAEIEQYGVGKFNKAARGAVLRYADVWKEVIPRIGRWVDMENDYKTMDASYTESVWWVFRSLYQKGLIYKGYQVLHLSPLLGTELSNFEVSQNYQDIDDIAVFVKLPLLDERGTSLLIWTTTAWTLPGNMAAAVNKDFTYAKVRIGDEIVILAKERVVDVVGESAEIIEEVQGSELVGRAYQPPFDYFKNADIEGKEKAWQVYHAPYVTLEDGTGIVHLAPAYGAEDMALAQENGIPVVHHVAKDGTFMDFVRDFRGMQAKPKGDHQRTDSLIAENLKARGLLYKKEIINHSYPHCWRTDAPLLNYAMDSWFVKVTDFKDELVSENEKVHWVPSEVGEKRFGNWLKNARDWSISRRRYWGAPLPVWEKKNGEAVVLGSVEDIKKYVKKSGNTYFLMRHGEAVSNATSIVSSGLTDKNPLTEKGKEQVRGAVENIKSFKPDCIITSPLERAMETARIVTEGLALSDDALITDMRLREIDFGVMNGKSREEYWALFSSPEERFEKAPEKGETVPDVKRRVGEFLYDIEKKYSNKKILIVAHEDILWMLSAVALGARNNTCLEIKSSSDDVFRNAEIRTLDFTVLPHNEEYELDLHRPYIDEVELVDNDGDVLKRIPDVFDCWFESGSMPYGQNHYPFNKNSQFEPKSGFFKRSRGYPADFIAEGMDQTRGWFYSLIVLGTALFGKSPYKNVIVNGLVLAADGRKMSKRLKNYPELMDVVNQYGADALRYYLLSSPIMRGEDLNFSEQGVDEVQKKIITRLDNVRSFYALYGRSTGEAKNTSENILDRWILSRLGQLIKETTAGMEAYELDRASRPLLEFIDDLSTWYVRRSRDRMKSGSSEGAAALATLKYTLLTLSKVMAPATPFYAEYLYRELREKNDPESVHLSSWPVAEKVDEELIADMKQARSIVSSALEARVSAGIKVRQPLASLTIKTTALSDSLKEVIADEVNVKEVIEDSTLAADIRLDTTLSEELRAEGLVRDFIRTVQQARKNGGFAPGERAVLTAFVPESLQKHINNAKEEILESACLSKMSFDRVDGEPVTVGDSEVVVVLSR